MGNRKNSKRNTLDQINPVISISRTLIAFSLYCLLFFLDYVVLSQMRERSFVWVIVCIFVLFKMICNVVYLFVKLESEILNRKPRRMIMIGYLGIRSVLWLFSDVILMGFLMNWYNIQVDYKYTGENDNHFKIYLLLFIIFTFVMYSLQYLTVRRIALYDTNSTKSKIFKWAKPMGLTIMALTTWIRMLGLWLPKNYFSEDLNLFKVLFIGFLCVFLIFLILAFEIYPMILQVLYYKNVELKKELLLGKDYKKVDITNENEVESQTKAQL